jgi:hypothetical protein
MMTIRFPVRAFLCGGLLASASPAFAWPVVDTVSSQGGGTFPAVWRTTFELSYSGPGDRYALFSVARLDGQVFGCAAPAGWTCHAFSKNPAGAVFQWNSGPSGPAPLTFAIDTIDPNPCVGMLFFYPFDENGVPVQSEGPEYRLTGCLLVDGPVPARLSSWGAMKSLYR